MKRDLVVVKLGGSVLTNKAGSGPPRFRRARALALCRSLSTVVRERRLVLVLGAGSFGHPQALRHGVGTKILRGQAKDRAKQEVSGSVEMLRKEFVRQAWKADLPVVPFAAAHFADREDPSLRPLSWLLDGGLVPVTGGDVVEDRRLGLRILSGDEIASRLVGQLRPRRVVFASDVPGVRVDGIVAQRLTRAQVRTLLPKVSRGKDATGGMHGKLRQALEILGAGVEVQVVDGRVPAGVARAVRGARAGTRLLP